MPPVITGSHYDNLSFSTTWTPLLMPTAWRSLQTAPRNYSLIEPIYYSSRTVIHHDPTINWCQKLNSLAPRSKYKIYTWFFSISISSILDIWILHFKKSVLTITFPNHFLIYVDNFLPRYGRYRYVTGIRTKALFVMYLGRCIWSIIDNNAEQWYRVCIKTDDHMCCACINLFPLGWKWSEEIWHYWNVHVFREVIR